MFSDKTLLILGAGASFEAGLPIGETLKEMISTALTVDTRGGDGHVRFVDECIGWAIGHANQSGSTSQKTLIDACVQISEALPLARSIDNYLNAHKQSKAVELCGKLGIVRCILSAEGKSTMQTREQQTTRERLDFRRLKGTWYNRFASLLFESSYEDMQRKLQSLSVIIFNYDRCFEHFMYHAIITYYGVAASEAAKVVKGMEIYHPYGTVGNLPWMNEGIQCGFGEDVNGERLFALAGNIKTYTEGVDRTASDIQAIHSAVRKARTVVVLGFGYIPLNMQLLKPENADQGHNQNAAQKNYFGTAFGMSDEDTSLVTHDIRNLVQTGYVQCKINNKLKCAELFTEYAVSLGAS